MTLSTDVLAGISLAVECLLRVKNGYGDRSTDTSAVPQKADVLHRPGRQVRANAPEVLSRARMRELAQRCGSTSVLLNCAQACRGLERAVVRDVGGFEARAAEDDRRNPSSS